MSRYFIDTEFIEGFHKPLFGKRRHFIDLISIGIVCEDGRNYSAISNEYKYKDADKWVQDNVIDPLYISTVRGDGRNRCNSENFHLAYGKSNKQIEEEIKQFISNEPVETIGSMDGTLFLSDKAKKIIKQGYTEPEFYGYYCVAPHTKILTKDLKWVSADSIEIGDKLVGFDEENPKGKGRSSKWKRYRTATCIGNKRVVMPCYKLYFDDGTNIICSEDHRWLTYNQKATRWLTTKQLLCTEKYKSNVVKFLDVWDDEPKDYDSGYLAASFDGEGYLTQSDITHKKCGISRVILGYAQKENEMYDKVLLALKNKKFNPSFKKTGGKDVLSISICKRDEIVKFLGSIRPKRLLSKFNPDSFGAISPFKTVNLIRKEFIGNTDVIALSTDVKTYIAEGLASHNCDYDWVLFCSLFGRMIDLPKGFPMYCRDLKQMFDEKDAHWSDCAVHNEPAMPNGDCDCLKLKGHPDYPKQENEHNALADAKWNLELYNFLKGLGK